MSNNNELTKQVIMNHIHNIFKAFLEQDRDAIKKAHTNDWVGFLGSSDCIERGIDAYMTKTELSLSNFKGVAYEIIDTEFQYYDNITLVYYIARYDYVDSSNKKESMMLRSLDIYRYEDAKWIQSGSHITPIPKSNDEDW